MDVGCVNPGIDKRFDENIQFGAGFSSKRRDEWSQYAVNVGGGNPGMDRKFNQTIKFGCRILVTIEDCEEPTGSGC